MRSSNIRRLAAGVLAVGTAVTGLTVATTPAVSAEPGAPDPVTLGTTQQTAAGSCWEIKQLRPSAPDGAYWLLTPSMPEPQQFYCDMTTDGGGWVLIAKGRNGWTPDYDGKGTRAALLSPSFAGGADVHQLPSQAVDQLLDGGRVADLTDGIRLRRARNAAGSQWQEARFKPSRRDRWVWSFNAPHPLTSYSFDGSSWSGGNTSSFGADSSYRRVITTSRSSTAWNFGFGYGTGVGGSANADSYLYSPSGGGEALPVTQVYLRPKIRSTEGFTAIPDGGTTAVEQTAQPNSLADPLPWGVTGIAGDTSREGSVEVQAFTQSGNRMYVGGNFRYVQQDASGTGRVEQSFLAAFDVDTGAWVSSFRPVLNEQVRALATLPDGRIVAGGSFTHANGTAATGIVALDPVTGAVDPTWSLTVENRLTGGVVNVRALELDGDYLYLGGAFTHLKGRTQANPSFMRNLGRVNVADASATNGWNPNLNGSVVDVDGAADRTRVYSAGYFTQADGLAAPKAAAFRTGATASLATPAWNPTWSSSNDYQQAIAEAGDRVWVGGSEHSLFSFSTSTFQRLSTNIFDPKGDVQAVTADGDQVFAGCHCWDNSYADAVKWPLDSTPWSQADTVHAVGMWDAATGARVPGFVPTFKTRVGYGVWAITKDSNDRLWVGGDIVTVSSRQSATDWSGGFARFAPRDATAPATPGGLRLVEHGSDSVRLAWNASSDPSGVRYQVLRNDRPIAVTTATSITVPHADDARYFVRAADGAGNVSASTGVLAVGGAAPQQVVPNDASWRWRYEAQAPPATWAQPEYDDTGWQQGTAVLGWGSTSVQTSLDLFDPTSSRPLTAYFRHAFTIDDPDAVRSLVLTGVANDGAVFYVNGVEVARRGLPDGPVTHQTYAVVAPREAAAKSSPVVVEVPLGLLRQGRNVIAAETHLNYRGTPDLTFEAGAVATLD
ncbi:fibrinogen-like YCDxxxxGGGW domain-containing protein [Nocardioides humi]|uniref:Fibrinogen C-terminal domain-containing protein n=1 Tax=Nocardioides humi TaxID=449461 RepID=A0ABN2AWZ4_9ACTN|nr:fibrinogen-like YCDxxxxGGGW domain-containing protein [Nocardioides humi]